MDFDFSKLAIPKASKPQLDPYKIFAGLPRLGGAPNDLWTGQADALSGWHTNRNEDDVLVSLNTGAGKTLVGLLIAQSLCNEGLENVLYICPTNDLVKQTADQARSVGISVTTRINSKYDNDLFEVGQAFCITNYHSVFNGLSSVRRKHFPSAIIFDDAHVAEGNMRDAFSLTIKHDSAPSLHSDLIKIFLTAFKELGREGEYRDALATDRPPHAVLVPPSAVRQSLTQIEAAFRSINAANHSDLKYAYAHLKDHLSDCAVVVRANTIEFSPPFLPSLSLDVFDRRVRRVYLSATLNNKADLVRAFGRTPSVVIEPNNDAGNGERLILSERDMIAAPFDSTFVSKLQGQHKVLVAVPSYNQARQWASLAVPPEPKSFSEQLDAFRRTNKGSFILVNRVDGIDLPHETCRLMVLDGVPRSEGLLERYQFEYLNMRTFAASRIANRLVQLFGRINRGRSDFGAFLIAGRELNIWLANDKHVALLPDLLKRQILLGRTVQSGMSIKTQDAVSKILSTVLLSRPRDQGWTTYYSQFLQAQELDEERTERARRVEQRNLEAAKAEALYAKSVWDRDYAGARVALDSIVADTARADEKLAGWHNLWIGAALDHEGDIEQSYLYFVRARGQLGLNLIIPVGQVGGESTDKEPARRIVANIMMLTNLGRETFTKQVSIIEKQLASLDGGTPAQMEEAVRLLGETLGFVSTRPDNDEGTGPDVYWRDTLDRSALGLELKTDKAEQSKYSKSEISQSLDHLSWMDNHLEGATNLGCVLVGPAAGYHSNANPTTRLSYIRAEAIRGLRDRVLAIIKDAYERLPKDRSQFIEDATADLTLSKLGSLLNARAFVTD